MHVRADGLPMSPYRAFCGLGRLALYNLENPDRCEFTPSGNRGEPESARCEFTPSAKWKLPTIREGKQQQKTDGNRPSPGRARLPDKV